MWAGQSRSWASLRRYRTCQQYFWQFPCPYIHLNRIESSRTWCYCLLRSIWPNYTSWWPYWRTLSCALRHHLGYQCVKHPGKASLDCLRFSRRISCLNLRVHHNRKDRYRAKLGPKLYCALPFLRFPENRTGSASIMLSESQIQSCLVLNHLHLTRHQWSLWLAWSVLRLSSNLCPSFWNCLYYNNRRKTQIDCLYTSDSNSS